MCCFFFLLRHMFEKPPKRTKEGIFAKFHLSSASNVTLVAVVERQVEVARWFRFRVDLGFMHCVISQMLLDCIEKFILWTLASGFRQFDRNLLCIRVWSCLVMASSKWWMCGSSGQTFVCFIGLVRDLLIRRQVWEGLRIRYSVIPVLAVCCRVVTSLAGVVQDCSASPKLCVCVQRDLLWSAPTSTIFF